MLLPPGVTPWFRISTCELPTHVGGPETYRSRGCNEKHAAIGVCVESGLRLSEKVQVRFHIGGPTLESEWLLKGMVPFGAESFTLSHSSSVRPLRSLKGANLVHPWALVSPCTRCRVG